MSPDEFLQHCDTLESQALAAFAAAEAVCDQKQLEAARIEFLGARSGRIKQLQKALGEVPAAAKPAAGKRFNQLKQKLEETFDKAAQTIAQRSRQQVEAQRQRAFDPTVPGTALRLGRLHPITQTIEELKDIMGRLGFAVAEGPEVEDEWHNFEALNIPPEHPARDPLENFYLAAAANCAPWQSASSGKQAQSAANSPPRLLRSQTSTVQIRVMEQMRPPVRVISCGRVYRPDTPDDTHFPMFHQIEGLMVDRDVTMGHLKSTLRLLARMAFAPDVEIRFRPSFFPFTEPSVEVDMSWEGGWIEMGGAGMVDPNVLRAVGYDPEQYSGFAFGLGIERICARRHGVTDIRQFFRNDVRFLHQF